MCALQVNDGQTPGPGLPGSQGEVLSKRCITLVKTALKPEIWQNQCRHGRLEGWGRGMAGMGAWLLRSNALVFQVLTSRYHGLQSCWKQLYVMGDMYRGVWRDAEGYIEGCIHVHVHVHLFSE